jgi:hypothetical protein
MENLLKYAPSNLLEKIKKDYSEFQEKNPQDFQDTDS